MNDLNQILFGISQAYQKIWHTEIIQPIQAEVWWQQIKMVKSSEKMKVEKLTVVVDEIIVFPQKKSYSEQEDSMEISLYIVLVYSSFKIIKK